jgi:secondary thiamine-phosphate synthase enzyme
MVKTSSVSVRTRGQFDIINITDEIRGITDNSGVSNGIVNVFCAGSTGAITTIEYEPGLKADIKDYFGKMFPRGEFYQHHETWGDDNGSGHLLSALIKTSFTVPIVNKRLTLGTWQQIVFIECDTRSRSRDLIVQIVGDC